jgi:putative ABC transport system permease protein
MMMQWRKGWRDLLAHPGRTATVLFALVLGLWGMGTVFVSYVVMHNDLNENFLRTEPAHLILTSADFGRLDIERVRQFPGVAGAEFRNLTKVRIEIGPDQWIPLWLYSVPDFADSQLAHLNYQSGEAIPPRGTMLVERNGLQIADIDIGRQPRIRVGHEVITAPVSGVTFDAAQPPSTQESFIYAYVSPQTYSDWTGQQTPQRLIIRFADVASASDVEPHQKALTEQLSAWGVRTQTALLPGFEEHPHQWQLNTILFVVFAVGCLMFILSAVLVNQLMKASLAQQVRQIGVMKAIGAQRRQIISLYLMSLLALGAIASTLAIPLAVLCGKAYAQFVSGILNFDVLTAQLPWFTYGVLVASGIGMPILFSMGTVLRGTRINVVSALYDYGVNVPLTMSVKERTARARGPVLLQLAQRNLRRSRQRLWVTLLSMALGVAIFNTGFNVRQSLQTLLDDVATAIGYDVQVVFAQPLAETEARALFTNLENVKTVQSWAGGLGLLQSEALSTESGVGVIALPYDDVMLNLPLVAGKWLSGQPEEVVFNEQALNQFGSPKVGDRLPVTINGDTLLLTLTGVVKQLDLPKIYVDQAYFNQVINHSGDINTLSFQAVDNRYDAVLELKQQIERRLLSSEWPVLYVVSEAERVKVIFDHLNVILSSLIFLSLLVLVVSAIGLASSTSVSVMERTREIGVMRAMGATPTDIFRLLTWEGLLVSLFSIALGLMLSLPLSAHAAEFFGLLMLSEANALSFQFSVSGLWITLLFTVGFGWLASRIPAQAATALSTRDALAYE